MSELKQFRLPDVGEGLTEADIVKWHVQPGDPVTVNQTILEIETAKSAVEIPCPYDGTVAELLVPEGTTADVGTPIIAIQVGSGPLAGAGGTAGSAAAGSAAAGSAAAGSAAASPADAGVEAAPAEGAVEPGVHGSPAPKAERQAVLVGYGVKLSATTRRPRRPAGGTGPSPAGGTGPSPATDRAPAKAGTAAQVAAPVSAPAASLSPALAPAAADTGRPTAPPAHGASAGRGPVLAKPPVRKLAKDLGVNLSKIAGTGPAGSISRDDVRAAATAQADADLTGASLTGASLTGASLTGTEAALASASPARVSELPREERIPIRGVRKHTAAAMVASAFTAPHVTELLQIDITETMAATARLKSMPDFESVRVSPLLLVAKAVLVAAARYPMVNSSWDADANEIVVRHYVNLGIAASTDRGLVVPNIKDAHALSLVDLARALNDLTQLARSGKATPADLRGGTISITNVGVFGVDTGTPIINPGESAILAFGQVKQAPWVVDGELAVRQVCTLALSFDHRIVDGDLGSAVLRDIGAMLTDPLRLLAWS
ncbi:MAG: dihydrolipoamide acetyltransferase family protein [Streptosporangiaceae bacterium]